MRRVQVCFKDRIIVRQGRAPVVTADKVRYAYAVGEQTAGIINGQLLLYLCHPPVTPAGVIRIGKIPAPGAPVQALSVYAIEPLIGDGAIAGPFLRPLVSSDISQIFAHWFAVIIRLAIAEPQTQSVMQRDKRGVIGTQPLCASERKFLRSGVVRGSKGGLRIGQILNVDLVVEYVDAVCCVGKGLHRIVVLCDGKWAGHK